MGGCVALAFAGLYPERASRLGLIDTTAWYDREAAANFRERAAAAREAGMAGLADFQAARWFSDEFRARCPELVRRTIAVFLANDFECYAASCALLATRTCGRSSPRCASRSRSSWAKTMPPHRSAWRATCTTRSRRRRSPSFQAPGT
jgi:pimeloyl-ACP methyl ester carboxylesterase